MRINFALSILVLCCFSLTKYNAAACGFDWVGACSSTVHLRINGSLDSFAIADCPSGTRFQGLHLGTLKNLSLANAKAITWESCQNNVSGVGLKYRVYEQGGGAGAFQTLELEQDHVTVLGDYTTRYRSKATDIDLASGLPTTIIPPICFGDSNGVIGVSVWGDQTGLFYQWSNIALNFYQQAGLPSNITVSCAEPFVSLCAVASPDALY